MYWLDKVIEEIKSRCSDFDVDKAMKHAWMIKKWAKLPPKPEGEWMMVVEVSAEPIGEPEKFWVPETPKLPWEEKPEICPECWKDPCECEGKKPEEPKEEPENVEANEKVEEDTPAEEEVKEEEAVKETWDKLEEATPDEEDRMNKILDAIKTFFPNEKTEDVLVRIVSKLIDR